MLLNLLLATAAIVAPPVAGYELTYDFATGEDLNDWDIHYNGVTTTSTAIASGTELTLSPTQSTVSAVDIQLEGDFYRVDVWAQMSGTAALSRYFDISIGNGSLTDNGGGTANAWHLTPSQSIGFYIQTIDGSNGCYIVSKNGGGVISKIFANIYTNNIINNELKITLLIEDQIAKLYFNDAFIIQQAFTLFEGGNINIHQGEHTAGSGSDTEISKIIAYSN